MPCRNTSRVPVFLIWLSAGMTIVGTAIVVVAEVKAPLIPPVLFPLSCLFLAPALLLWRCAAALRQGHSEVTLGSPAAAVAASIMAALVVLLGGFLEDDCNDALTCGPDHAAASLLYLGGKIFVVSGVLSVIALLAMRVFQPEYGSSPKEQ